MHLGRLLILFGLALAAGAAAAREERPLTLDSGAVVVGSATLGLASFATGNAPPRPALDLAIAEDGARADSLRPAIRGDVSLTRGRMHADDGRIVFLESLANHGMEPTTVRLRWTAYLPGDRASALHTASGWRSAAGWHLESSIPGRLVNGWPAGTPTYPGHDPGYIAWEVTLDLRPGERKAVLAAMTPAGHAPQPALDWLSAAQTRALMGWNGGGGRSLAGGRTAALAQWQAWRKELGAEALLEDSLAHAAWLAARSPGLTPLSAIHPQAYAEARRVAPGDERPLAGLPVAVKDIIDVAGLPTLALAEPLPRAAPRDALIVERLRAAGAVVLGKTAYDEDFGDYGMHRATGRLRGLIHPDLTVTGSSGGSAIAVAAGIVPLAMGSDTCGSLGTPASHAGIATIRPTVGLLPYQGARPLDPDLDTVGPIVARAGDLQQVLEALTGQAPSGDAPQTIRLGLIEPWPDTLPPISAEVGVQFGRVMDRLRAAGIELVPVALPDWSSARAALRAAPDRYPVAAALTDWLAFRDDPRSLQDLANSPNLLAEERADLAALAGARQDADARERRETALAAARAAVVGPIARFDLDGLIMPATLAWPGLLDVTRPGAGEPAMCPLSAYPRLPQITLPIAVGKAEPPLGAALIGSADGDWHLVLVAERIASIVNPKN
ncbi:Asp-tRNAAsn/Glu-tRNAGln amidotransferase A subunit [Erythrobacter dokdonensis DSW-74]|uniref:Asp-tRNAAsn/Glu-tRNAGln amidotransferase A subunit n=1 Tax=Erythrobacter dokdonensis DSW-74 TaxID=1300349 RepID=A0A1A7BHP8_9SPHN|nr:Asp-tRNAAsn/Glu-tRNAGln amidotransferase A subunit [Erythrobacter dokdonensis DSW-74]